MPESKPKKQTAKGAHAPAKAGARSAGSRRKPVRKPEIGKVKRSGEVIQNRKPQSARPIMRRPKSRRATAPVTAEYGKVSPRRVRRGFRSISGLVKRQAKQKIITVKVKSGKMPWHTIFAALLSTMIIMTMVINYVRLNELTNQYSRMQRQIVSLSETKRKLGITMDQKNDLLYFEKEAVEMGMVKSDRVAKRYINLDSGEKIEVPEKTGGGLVKWLTGIFERIASPFRNIFS